MIPLFTSLWLALMLELAEKISAQSKEIGRNSILLIEKDGDGENIILGNGGARQC